MSSPTTYENNILFLTITFHCIQNASIVVQERLAKTKEEADEVVGSIDESRRLIDDYREGIASGLQPQLQELKQEGDSKISLASEKRKCANLIE